MPSKILSVGVMLIACMMLTSCAAPQQRYLADVKESLELDELGTVVCKEDHVPFPVIGTGSYRQFIGITGSDNYLQVVDRLIDQGFVVSGRGVNDDGTHLLDPESTLAIVLHFTNPPTIKQQSPMSKRCELPTDGLVTVELLLK